MKCSLCGLEFNENEASNSCDGCIFKRNCNSYRCPNCGYETPKTPEIIEKIINRRIAK
jgi:rubredoxin